MIKLQGKMKMNRKEELIKSLKLKPHPEGGFFAENYRSREVIKGGGDDEFPSGRNYCTGIYYLLGSEDISCFHRIRSDEVWHHYEGSSITIHVIHEDGLYEALYLGKELSEQQQPQCVVPAGAWFGVTVDEPGTYVLCGCTVSPGFDFEDFEMADRYRMLQAFPEHEVIIRELTRGEV
jgi:predicted cupin superfamily sugar epimerase